MLSARVERPGQAPQAGALATVRDDIVLRRVARDHCFTCDALVAA
jgi:hypothetical protein